MLKSDETPTAPRAAAGLPQMIWHMGETPDQWAARDLESKTCCLIRASAVRLRGMADVLYATAPVRDHARWDLIFLADSARDLAATLERLDTAWRERFDAADAVAVARGEAKARKAQRTAK